MNNEFKEEPLLTAYINNQLNKKPIEFTAEIELTDFKKAQDGRARAFGKVFNDSRKRFEDGVEIITFWVINAETYKTDGYIKTQNSVYKIREPK
ncbi:hypothetical protein [Xenorhabdus cabanillasii]|uniref:Uncharacterized protein n=1 Tax=Xenorhabdus cabanillasii JM26 TaxID=1427517 RepID=W1J8G0_9GAMM|nr:hypothetical protein [Xenorhabdus cabanillasii]PHM76922.1 hypothetical protein Xcab_02489 [Xenorhabdus cabanillasii JM26]CDL86308.1 hypothetical protein XCR1_2980011 [Xenorhabdus cabanillasii JM26]